MLLSSTLHYSTYAHEAQNKYDSHTSTKILIRRLLVATYSTGCIFFFLVNATTTKTLINDSSKSLDRFINIVGIF